MAALVVQLKCGLHLQRQTFTTLLQHTSSYHIWRGGNTPNGKQQTTYLLSPNVRTASWTVNRSDNRRILEAAKHLQVTERTCWHGNAGGRLNADPKNVVGKQIVLPNVL
ncbi:iron-sulfur clusters transporter ABCB7, mitochondrial-like [Oncorhynchus keta]|uniref:iron-sulfur clusters transporter ABCB7, mitochondrial-like n=1 Tax=Oncorhynchus keta TaxID=8018 RepID=UPI00227B20AC|nr:iron-sulfur clusters transporter ABCB7, mitochondrial-like [Oncorhynchus keta]